MESGGRGGGFLVLTKASPVYLPINSLFPWSSPKFYSHYTISITTRCSRWDSNAEPVGSGKFKFKFRDKGKKYSENDDEQEDNDDRNRRNRRWWSDEPSYTEEEEEAASILEEAIDSLWILKVFKSYGWALPPIIISWLLATGPKAFLMTLALPLGQSAISFVFKLLWGRRTQSKPKRKSRKRRKPFSTSPTDVDEMQETVEGNKEFRSWVVNNDGSFKRDSENNASYFGGWDELDGMESVQRQRSPRRRKTTSANGKLGTSRRRTSDDVPLLLRLLIAVFPFLGSWTRMFW